MSILLRLAIFLRPERARIALALGCTGILAAATAFMAYLFGPLLEALFAGVPPERTSTLGKLVAWLHPSLLTPTALLTALPVGLVLLAAVKAVAQFGQNDLLQGTGTRVTARLRRRLYEKLLFLPPSYFQDKHSGELFTRFSTDVAQVETALTQALVVYLSEPLKLLALGLLCALLDLRLLLILGAAIPVAAWPIPRFAKKLKGIARSSQGALGKTTERVSEVLAQMRVVQAYRQEGAEQARFDAAQDVYLGEMRRSFFVRAAFTPILETLGVAGLGLALFFAARAIAQGTLSPAHLLTFLATAMLMYQPVKALSTTGQLIVGAAASTDRLFEILDADTQPDAPGATPLAPFTTEVRFESVDFSYGDEAVIRGLELTLRAGEKVALVGPSGAGKSTLANLLLGFWRPGAGRICIDGRDLASATLASWRAQVALVTQEAILFHGSVEENLRAGCPHEVTRAQLIEAARAAGALTFIGALPGGFAAPVGERGGLLSGGQRQRLALARALLRAAPFLVLDEATSALDSESEKQVEAGLDALLQGRTALIIAHRLSTIQRADRILVLDRGRIAEQGTHAQLLALNGLYAQLWQSFIGARAA